MKKLIHIIVQKGWPGLLLAFFIAMGTASCKDNEGNDGIPVIKYLRVTDPTLADSTFTDVNPGTMIAVIGENLGGVTEVYINNQKISFNSTYSTPTSLIITVPYDEDFKLSGPNPELPSELRVVTNHGIAVYPLHVLSPGPGITRIAATYPLKPGSQATLIGTNFYEIQRIYFTTDSINVTQEITDYQISNDFKNLTFTVSDKMTTNGWIIMDCYTDDACIEYTPEGPKPIITGISSIMPVVGSEVTITGQNFIDVSNINLNGEIDIPGENVTVSESFDELTFIMPQAPSHSGHISITSMGGTAEMEDLFYPIENMIVDYDGIGSFSWGTEPPFIADGANPPYISTGNCIGAKGTIDSSNLYWWKQFINTAKWPSTDVIPSYTQISELELQFECYLELPMDGPVIQISMGHPNGTDTGGNPYFTLENYVPINSFTEESETGKWMQCCIPLTKLVEEKTWGEFLNNKISDELNFYINYPGLTKATNIEIYVDNIRIIPIKQEED